MQRALILARRLPVLSSLRPKSARYPEHLQQMRPAGSLFRPFVQANYAHELRAFHASSSALAKHLNFNLADIGEGIAEVELLQWFVAEGQSIKAFDRICEVQSDKATVEISSRYDGKVLKLCHAKNAIAKVGAPLMVIEVADDVAEAPGAHAGGDGHGAAASAPALPQEAATQMMNADGSILTTPAVRRLAREHQVDLSKVHGSGRDGRIMKDDVLAVIEQSSKSVKSTVPSPTPAAPPRSTVSMPQVQATSNSVHPIRGYTRTMIKTMTAQALVPHFGYCDEIVFDEVIKLRNAVKASAAASGVKFSYLPVVIKAVSLSLLRFPQLNAKMTQDMSSLEHYASHNIGVAMATPTGLVVPNVKNVQALSLLQIASELTRLTELARGGAVPPSDLTGGTFSLSNIGAIGGTYASPVVLPGELAIGALGKLRVVPRYNSTMQLQPTTVMEVSWSADHRVVDGATIAEFSNLFKQHLESPHTMLLNLR